MYRGRIRVIRRRVSLGAGLAHGENPERAYADHDRFKVLDSRRSLSLWRPLGPRSTELPAGTGARMPPASRGLPVVGGLPPIPAIAEPEDQNADGYNGRALNATFLTVNDGVDYVAAPRSGDRCTTRNMNRYGFTRQHTALRGHAQNVKGITAASGRDEQPRASRTSWIPHPVANTCSSAR